MIPRGIRNNNPGNIRKAPGVTWEGQAPSQPDPSFVSYLTPPYGLRAIAKILLSYEREGFRTVRAIITRWAPSVENDTAAYIDAVSKATGFAPDQVIDVSQPSVMIALLQAIVVHENGADPYLPATFQQAVQLAGLSAPRAA